MERKEFISVSMLASLGACLPIQAHGFLSIGDRQLPLSDFEKSLTAVGRALEFEDYYVWCNSPIEGPDGKIHVFFSRWPKAKSMSGWTNSSEIAHAVANTPEGPYEYVSTILAPRGAEFWDVTTCHNPSIHFVDGKYALFFMGNSNGKLNTQRIGLATADSLYGPWERPDEPLLQPGNTGEWDDHCTTNPSFLKHPNGAYWLYYKSFDTEGYVHPAFEVKGNRKYGLAIATSLFLKLTPYKTMNEIKLKKGINLNLWFTMILWFYPIVILTSQTLNIKNDRFWDTKGGEPIYSQGGGIFKFIDPDTHLEKYYWYGVHYEEAELYRNDPSITQPRSRFVSVTCYTSTDLVNWESEKPVLTKDEINQNYNRTGWMGRLGVAYVKELKKYALFIQHNDQVLITVSDRPTGPFKWHQRINMEPMIGTSNTGDQTVFTDEDSGISYLIYSYGKGRHKIYISEIGVKNGMVNLIDCTQVFKGVGREGNCMFKHNGKYYLFASNLYGWDSSYAYYLVSDDIRGPYSPTNNMLITPGSMDDYTHITQTGFFTKLKRNNKELVIYCGDRWSDFAGNGLGYNQWCPITFEGETPYFNSLHSWNFDLSTADWEVANDNNYAKNGSFEADRRHIPSPVKPIQEQLKSWFTKVYEGNVIVVGSDDSPVLNYFNTEEDRKQVIGEKSLNMSDSIPFKRKVYQTIESSPFVALKNGVYKLSAKIKNTTGFSKLMMYAESGGKQTFLPILEQNPQWTLIEIDAIDVSNGKVEIGFIAKGIANAACLVDDVTFVKTEI